MEVQWNLEREEIVSVALDDERSRANRGKLGV